MPDKPRHQVRVRPAAYVKKRTETAMEELLVQLLPAGWDIEDETTLVCPCGDVIETDGACPQGCLSPLRSMGLI